MRDTITVMLADDHRILHYSSRKTAENHRANTVRKAGVLAQVGLTTTPPHRAQRAGSVGVHGLRSFHRRMAFTYRLVLSHRCARVAPFNHN
ncbi:MAG: hypothetical protein JRI71_07705 [Deltaproteobacteria bacterium]|nr:hypothetical protein [Deltaproteobacteria bacterium]MBW2077419.1 hypothetical protein [Deltaproteobacteria bacterium]